MMLERGFVIALLVLGLIFSAPQALRAQNGNPLTTQAGETDVTNQVASVSTGAEYALHSKELYEEQQEKEQQEEQDEEQVEAQKQTEEDSDAAPATTSANAADTTTAPPRTTTTTSTRRRHFETEPTTNNAYDVTNRPQLRNIKTLDEHCLNNHCYNFQYPSLDEVAFFDIKAEVRINRGGGTYDIVNARDYELLVFENSTFARFPLHLFYALGVQELDMRECAMQALTWESFLMAQKLRVLLLSNNRLRTIGAATFKFASALQYLFLDANHLTHLSGESFEGLADLRYLDLSHNRLEQLPANLFAPLAALEELHLNSNRLRTLSSALFPQNRNLRIVRVAENHLRLVDEAAFRHQTRLLILELENNPQLSTLVLMVQLQNLMAANCALTRVNIYGYVRNVDLSYNRILELYFAQPQQLEILNLRNNSLQQIASLTQATKLTTLDLADNHDLHTLPSPWQVNSLKRLDLGNTGLKQLPIEALAEQTQLTYLNVSYNQLREINPFNFKYLEHLEQFDIRGNDWNCYNLNILMDMLLKPFGIAYGYDNMDPQFPGEYVNDIACMYRLEESQENNTSNEEVEDHKEAAFDEFNFEAVEQGVKGGRKLAQLQTQPAATADVLVEGFRRELKAIVGIYEQKFYRVQQQIDDLNKRLQAFERFNQTLWQQATIMV